MSKFTKLILFAAVACLLATACSAATIVKQADLVPAGSSAGWSVATVTSANTQFCVSPFSNPNGSSSAFWMSIGGDGSDSSGVYPGQAWLGTNAFNGTKLSDITTLTYDTWLSNSGIWKGSTRPWYDKWSTPRQQMTMVMVIEPAPGQALRVLYFRPRGNDYADYVDGGTQNHWVTNDARNNGYWFDFNYQVSMGQSTWAQIVARYPSGKIAQPTVQVGGQWPESVPASMPNGCGLSIKWGAEMYGLSSGGSVEANATNPISAPQYSVPCSTKNWWRDALGGIGWVDNFQIAITGVNGGEPQAFDFEATDAARTVTSSTLGLQHIAAYRSSRTVSWVAFGKVVRHDNTNHEFWLSDGTPSTYTWADLSPNYTRIYCEGGVLGDEELGNWKRVFGVMVPAYSNRNNGEPIPNRIHTYITDVEPGP